MHNQPLQPLADLEALREENKQLRNEMSYLVICLFNTQWSNSQDREYAVELANYICRKLSTIRR